MDLSSISVRENLSRPRNGGREASPDTATAQMREAGSKWGINGKGGLGFRNVHKANQAGVVMKLGSNGEERFKTSFQAATRAQEDCDVLFLLTYYILPATSRNLSIYKTKVRAKNLGPKNRFGSHQPRGPVTS